MYLEKILKILFLKLILIVILNLNNVFSVSATRQENENTNTIWNNTWEDTLKRDLLVNYDKNSRPSSTNQNRTEIFNFLTLKHIDVDEMKGVVNLYGWMRMEWEDEKLQWNSSEYGGINVIRLSGYEIWRPSLIVYNKATGNDIDHIGNVYVIVYNNGLVLWVPPFKTSFFCEFDFRLWPFDTQKCTLIYGSWILDDNEIIIKVKEYDDSIIGAEIESIIENNEWNLKNVTVRKNAPQLATAISFDIEIERRSPMYKSVVIIPAACIILLTLSSFWLPPQTNEKILLNGINLICATAFLVYFAQMLPTLAMNTPLVVVFYSTTLVLITISMLISVFVLYLSNTKHKYKIPIIIKKFLNSPFGKVLCLMEMDLIKNELQPDRELQNQSSNFDNHDHQDENDHDDHQIINRFQIKSTQSDWIMLAMAIDHLCFVIYSIIFIVLAAVYAV